MTRRSLRPDLNRIRAWVRQGRTDAWIAHQLEVTVQQIQAFKREQGLEPEGDLEAASAGADYDEEIDLRAEDDALIAAELEAAEAERSEDEEEEEEEEEEIRGGRGTPCSAASRQTWRSWRSSSQAVADSARGDLRPWRGGLRSVAGPRGSG